MMLEDIGAYLQKKGIGTVSKDIFFSAFPASPIECLALFEYQGEPPDQMAGVETPGLQVCVRTANYKAGYSRLQKAHKALKVIGYEDGDCPEGIEIDSTRYYRAIPVLSGAIPLGKDENGKIRLAKNYYIVMEEKNE